MSAGLTSGRLLARNTLWNLVGQASPIVVGVVAIPFLVNRLGIDRFGVLTLAWMVVGYFSLLDLGLGRALTKLVAEKLGRGEEEHIPGLVWTTLFLMTGLGVGGALLTGALAPWLARHVFKIPPGIVDETTAALYWLALAVPVVIGTTALRGILEAYQRFDLVNYVRVPMGAFNFAGPALALLFSRSLETVVAVLILGRALALWVHFAFCRRLLPALRGVPRFDGALVRPLLAIGGWMTVSNIISPIMVHVDRFLISAVLSVSAVAYYATPYELVTKLWIVPGALVAVLFPAFSAATSSGHRRAAALLDRGMRYVLLSLFPLTLVVVALARPGLELWLGATFAGQSTRVMQWLSAGVFINSVGQVPFAYIQGSGRADFTAKLHMAELPFYLLTLWFAVRLWGIEGAAIAWVLRATIDSAVLVLVASRMLPEKVPIRQLVLGIVLALALLLAGSFVGNFGVGIAFAISCLVLFAVVSWSTLLRSEERAVARAFLGVGAER